MHELSIASAVMDHVLGFVQGQPDVQVLKVRLAVGELTHLQVEQLKFCYGAITENTPIADSKLEIETVPAEVACPACSYRGPPSYWRDALAEAPVVTLQCPNCGDLAEVAQGQECAIRGIQCLS